MVELQRYAFRNRKEWHEWLEQNHSITMGMYLVYYNKGSRKPSISYDEAVDEAISYGWIDSTGYEVDSERYMQLFTPRKAGSSWSRLNKERVERIISR